MRFRDTQRNQINIEAGAEPATEATDGLCSQHGAALQAKSTARGRTRVVVVELKNGDRRYWRHEVRVQLLQHAVGEFRKFVIEAVLNARADQREPFQHPFHMRVGTGSVFYPSFQTYTFAVNPGIEKTFPWLAQLAANFDEYEFKQLIFTFRSTISNDASTSNGQVGSVIMATDYNAASPIFTDKGTMLQYAGAVSAKVTDNIMEGVECDPRQNAGAAINYVRSAPVLIGQDIKTYDIGTFTMAISGTPANFSNQPIGELWVSYKVALRKPKLYTGLGNSISRDDFAGATTGTNAIPGLAMQYPLGTAILPVDGSGINKYGKNFSYGQQNSIGCFVQTLYTAAVPNRPIIQVIFPPNATSYYEIRLQIVGTVIAATIPSVSVQGNMTLVPDIMVRPGNVGYPVYNLYLATDGCSIIHLKPATNYGGSNAGTAAYAPNVCSIQLTFDLTATVTSTVITVTEYNTQNGPGIEVPLVMGYTGFNPNGAVVTY